jgi:D-alanyl-D-alanine carboxypeptidase
MRLSGIAFICLTALVAAGRVAAAAQAAPKTSESARIEGLIGPQARADLFSGAILVQRGDHVVFQRAYGFASWELRVANRDHTLFGIGSITKPLTEAMVSLLVSQHRLDLRAPVDQYIPGFPRGPNGGKPTIEQLLSTRRAYRIA